MAKWNAKGSLAVVTGASSGIGKCLCIGLVQSGCRVIAVARREERLALLASEMQTENGASGSSLVGMAGDITDPETRQRIAETIDDSGAVLDLLVNNAGIGAIGPFEQASPSRLRSVMEVNFFAPAELTRLLLPRLKASSDAVICNIGSVLGHRAVPDKSEYCASKFALHGWSDALRAELAGTSVHVTLVSPSTTRSEFFGSLVETDAKSRSKSLGSWSAERVASAAMKAIRGRRDEVILSLGGKLLVYADRLSPPLMNRVLRRP